MNIKSLLLGSAAALVAVSGARVADAVVIAEPEPMEYVRGRGLKTLKRLTPCEYICNAGQSSPNASGPIQSIKCRD
jgi:hypothetical protein